MWARKPHFGPLNERNSALVIKSAKACTFNASSTPWLKTTTPERVGNVLSTMGARRRAAERPTAHHRTSSLAYRRATSA